MKKKEYSAGAVKFAFWFMEFRQMIGLLHDGNSFDEIKRIVLALQKADKDSCATPADWRPGDDVIIPTAGSCGVAKERVESKDASMYCLDWFLCFKKEK